MTRNLALALAVTTAMAACGRGADEGAIPDARAPSASTATPPSAEPTLPAANTAAGFLARAALVDLYEQRSAQIALDRSLNADVRRFAQLMLDDHGRMAREAQAAASAQNISVAAPTRPDGRRQDLLSALHDAGADDFDDRYIDQQTEAHDNALQLMREYADTGDNPALKDWARRTAPALENHLQMVKALDRGQADDPAGANLPRAQDR